MLRTAAFFTLIGLEVIAAGVAFGAKAFATACDRALDALEGA